MFGYAVMGEQLVQEGTKPAALRGPRVKDLCGRCCCLSLPPGGGLEVQDSVAEGGVYSQGVEQHSHVGVPFVQVGKGSVECKRLRHLWIDWDGMQIGVGLGFLG